MQRSASRGTGLDLPPELTQFGEHWSAVLALESLLTPSAREACPTCSAAGHVVDEQLSGRQGEGQLPHVPDGTTADGVAAMLGAELVRGAMPATRLFATLLRREIRLDKHGAHVKEPGKDEKRWIGTKAGELLYVRNGTLMAGTIVCARTAAWLARDRIVRIAGIGAWRRIQAGEPIGTVLGPRGLVPGRRQVEVLPGANPAVKTWRVLVLSGERIGTVTEEIPESLCQRLAA
jgi:hypothetical protein